MQAAGETGPSARRENPEGTTSDNAVVDVKLDTIYLKDKDGNLQPVLNWSYEKFIQLINESQGHENGPRQPLYSLQNLTVTGSADDTTANLAAKISLLLHSDQWVRIPLGLSRSVLKKQMAHAGKGEYFLHYDENGDGYVIWLRGTPNGEGAQQHTFTLDLVVPLVKLGGETILRLSTPRSATSDFTIHVNVPKAIARVSENSTLTETKNLNSRTTQLQGKGLGGEFELSWREQQSNPPKVATVLEASSAILARIDGRSVQSEARLMVRSSGGEFQQFRVRLPQGATLLSSSQPGYTISVAEQDTGTASSNGKQDPKKKSSAPSQETVVDVKLDLKTAGPVEVRLVTEQLLRSEKGDSRTVELAGFVVEPVSNVAQDAVRQWGYIAVEVIGDWQLEWVKRLHLHRVEELPESLRRDGVIGFEYFSGRSSLEAKVKNRPPHVRVEPEYVLLVGEQEATLRAKLNYTIRAAKVFELKLNLNDVPLPKENKPGAGNNSSDLTSVRWEIEKIGPANIVNTDLIDSEGDTVTIPLMQPTAGQITLQLEARCKYEPGSNKIVYPIPAAEATSQTPATVVVLPNDNIELIPLDDAMQGLVPQPSSPNISLPTRQQDPLFYIQDQANVPFATEIKTHSQSVAVEVNSKVKVNRTGATVHQRLDYRVQYVPLDRLTLDLPREIAESQQLELLLGNERLSLASTNRDDEQSDDGAENNKVRLRVLLPQPLIGKQSVVINYPVNWSPLREQQSEQRQVSLVMPADGTLEQNQLDVEIDPGIKATLRGQQWKPNNDPTSYISSQLMQLESELAQSVVPLALRQEQAGISGTTVVQQAWIQSWLTSSARQDRAVYRFHSSEKQLKLTLPAGVGQEAVEVLLDGKLQTLNFTAPGQLVVSLTKQQETPAADAQNFARVLELRYHFDEYSFDSSSLDLEPPHLDKSIALWHVYWQVVLPGQYHMISSPPGFTREFVWGWNGLYWGRKPTLQQAQLERHVGASQSPIAERGTNVYLFSSPKQPTLLKMGTASRGTIILIASGFVLLVGLIFMHFPAVRRSDVLFGAAVVLLAWGFWYPELALLVAQASTLGIVLAVLSGMLRHWLGQRSTQQAAIPASGSSLIHKEHSGRSSTEQYTAPASAFSKPTSTATMALKTTESES